MGKPERSPPMDAAHAAARAVMDEMESPDRSPRSVAMAAVSAYLAFGSVVGPRLDLDAIEKHAELRTHTHGDVLALVARVRELEAALAGK